MKPVAYEGNEKYIFISYAHKDSEIVMAIMNSLQAEGYRIWYDDGIIPGSEWPENIAMHLNDASMVIAMISPNSMASHNCRREINFALSKQKPFLSIILEPTEMSLGMEMQLSAQNIVMRQNYSKWEDFINKIMLCPGLDPCKITDGEELDVIRPRGFQMESAAQPFVYGAPIVEEAPKKKRSPLALICGVLAAALIGVGAWFFFGNGSDGLANGLSDGAVNISAPKLEIPQNYEVPTSEGDLLVDGRWASGKLHVYALDKRTFEIMITDHWLPNGYTTSETPGNLDPYWNIGLRQGLSDTYAIHVRGLATDVYDLSADYMQQNAVYAFYSGIDVTRSENTLIVTVELPDEVAWDTSDLECVYINVGTEEIGRSEHYEFWR